MRLVSGLSVYTGQSDLMEGLSRSNGGIILFFVRSCVVAAVTASLEANRGTQHDALAFGPSQ
jgi:hypothetical protein